MALSDAQLADLSAELTTDPLGRGYASLDDQAAANDLNSIYRDYSASIAVAEFESVMRVSGKWTDYRDRASDTATNPHMAELMDVFNTRIPDMDLRGHPNRIAKESEALAYWSNLLDSCVSEGSLGTFAAEEAKKLSDTQVARSWELVDQRVTGVDVQKARALQ